MVHACRNGGVSEWVSVGALVQGTPPLIACVVVSASALLFFWCRVLHMTIL